MVRVRFTPWTARSPDSTASTISALEDEFENSLLIDQIEAADMNTGIYPWFNVMDSTYGATGDGSTDDSSAIQACIDACEAAGGGTVYFPAGSYFIGTPLTVTKPIVLLGAGTGGDTTDIFDESGLTEIVTADGIATSDTFITFASATSGNVLEGCGIEGILFRTPTYRVQYAITLKGVVKGRFQGLRFDQFGGATTLGIFRLIAGDGAAESCQYNTFEDIAIQMTGASAVGFILDGESNGGSCYQNVFRRIFVQHGSDGSGGHGVWLRGDVDNNHFYDCQFTRGGSAGDYGVYATAGSSSHPRHNAFYGLNGHVYEEKECLGNTYDFKTSENSSYTQEGSPAHPASYTVVDNTTRQMFTTQPYVMSDAWFIPAPIFGLLTGTPVLAPTGGTTPVVGWKLDPSTDESVGVFLKAPQTWGNGTIATLDVHYNAANSDNAATWRLQPSIRCAVDGTSLGAADYSTGTTVTISNAGDNEADVESIAVAVDFTEGEYIAINILRDADASGGGTDSAASDITFLGVVLHFEADGPNSAGDFDIPARST